MFDCMLLGHLGTDDNFARRSDNKLPSKRYRNQRVFPRFSPPRSGVMVRSDLDIFAVRNISKNGYCCEAPSRAIDRLVVGDAYTSKLRYHGETYEVEVLVAWKSKKLVGFQLRNPSEDVAAFFERLVRPMQIGATLKSVRLPARVKASLSDAPHWWRGDFGAALFLWLNADETVKRWSFEFDGQYVSWSAEKGVETGVLQIAEKDTLDKIWAKTHHKDVRENVERKTFAIDALMAANLPQNVSLLESLGVELP